MCVQAVVRGFLRRNDLFNGEAAMTLHIAAMEEAEAAKKSMNFGELDKLIGRAEQRDYLAEVAAQRTSLSTKINELERGRYYLSAAKQKQVPSCGGALIEPPWPCMAPQAFACVAFFTLSLLT